MLLSKLDRDIFYLSLHGFLIFVIWEITKSFHGDIIPVNMVLKFSFYVNSLLFVNSVMKLYLKAKYPRLTEADFTRKMAWFDVFYMVFLMIMEAPLIISAIN